MAAEHLVQLSSPDQRQKRHQNRWLNIVFGSIYSVIMILVIRGGCHYVLYGLIEIALTVRIVWHAWIWPKQPTR